MVYRRNKIQFGTVFTALDTGGVSGACVGEHLLSFCENRWACVICCLEKILAGTSKHYCMNSDKVA